MSSPRVFPRNPLGRLDMLSNVGPLLFHFRIGSVLDSLGSSRDALGISISFIFFLISDFPARKTEALQCILLDFHAIPRRLWHKVSALSHLYRIDEVLMQMVYKLNYAILRRG